MCINILVFIQLKLSHNARKPTTSCFSKLSKSAECTQLRYELIWAEWTQLKLFKLSKFFGNLSSNYSNSLSISIRPMVGLEIINIKRIFNIRIFVVAQLTNLIDSIFFAHSKLFLFLHKLDYLWLWYYVIWLK